MELRLATKQKSKIRLGLSAVSGGGKTYSALLIAYGMCGDWSKIGMIDTENGSGDLYSDLGAYNILPLEAPYTPENYSKAMKICEAAGMEVIIVDSITHEWDGKGGILEIHGAMTGNSFANWASLTPRHQKFIDAILTSKCHVITTVRRKQDYELVTNEKGKLEPQKVGLKEVTREGFDYELTVNLNLDTKHNATSLKDRTGLFMDQPAFIPSIETGKMILAWCESGAEPIMPNYKKQLIECKNLVDLQAVWLSLSADDKLKWNDLKEKIKGELTRVKDFAPGMAIVDNVAKQMDDKTALQPDENGVIDAITLQLNACKTLPALKKAWDAIPAEIKPDYLALKDSVKELLTKK